MTLRERAAVFLRRYEEALTPLLQDHDARIELSLSASEARVVFRALTEFTAPGHGWQPIATVPSDRAWDIDDGELSEDVSLARAVDDGAPLFFLLQEKAADEIYEHTMWCPAVRWPKPPQKGPAEVIPLR